MKLTILKFCSVLCAIAVFIGIFTTYVFSTKLNRAKVWLSTYEEYSQSVDVSKYDFFGVDVFEMEEIVVKNKSCRIYSLTATILVFFVCIFCNLMYLGELKENQVTSDKSNFKFKNIILTILTVLGVIGTNVGAYILYSKYIVFQTPEEKIQDALNYMYSPMSEYEASQSESRALFYFLICLIVVSVLTSIISSVLNYINQRKTYKPKVIEITTPITTVDITPSQLTQQDFTEHECLLISEYRKRPEMQEAVDRLLGIAQTK